MKKSILFPASILLLIVTVLAGCQTLAEQASKYFFISIKLAEIYYEQTKLYTDLQYSQEERISLLEQETKYES